MFHGKKAIETSSYTRMLLSGARSAYITCGDIRERSGHTLAKIYGFL